VTVTVTFTTYTPNATATMLPASEQLALTGLKSGSHTVTVTLAYTQTKTATVHRGHRKVELTTTIAATKTIKAQFTVC
jgi:hypothetical protein